MYSVRRGRLWARFRYLRKLYKLFRTAGHHHILTPRRIDEIERWIRVGFSVPSPTQVRRETLKRFGLNCIWIETGTHLGETTAFLSEISTHTFSIEPEPNLARRAVALFADDSRVRIIEGTSEQVLPGLLSSICNGDKPTVSFWLDGHYSKDLSNFRGPSDTPISNELQAISAHLDSFAEVSILIDDMRCFDPQTTEFETYPKKSFLVEWAESRNLFWTIEHDIFIATSKPTAPFLF